MDMEQIIMKYTSVSTVHSWYIKDTQQEVYMW